MKFKDLTRKNVRAFLIGNFRLSVQYIFGASYDGFLALPEHKKEQVIYRMQVCDDCLKVMSCQYCGCSLPGKFYTDESCNEGKRFPDLMEMEDWIKYKEDNNIIIKDLKD